MYAMLLSNKRQTQNMDPNIERSGNQQLQACYNFFNSNKAMKFVMNFQCGTESKFDTKLARVLV